MERSIFAALIGGLLGITTLGGLTFVGSVPESPAAAPSRPEGEWRLLDPVTYENISVFPVSRSYSQTPTPFLTPQKALPPGGVPSPDHAPRALHRPRAALPATLPPPQTGPS